MSNDTAADLFTEAAHQCDISIIFIKQSRTEQSVNAHYFILLKHPRDRQQVQGVSKKM